MNSFAMKLNEILDRAEQDNYGKVFEPGLLEMKIVRGEEYALLDTMMIVEEEKTERRVYRRDPFSGGKHTQLMVLRPFPPVR